MSSDQPQQLLQTLASQQQTMQAQIDMLIEAKSGQKRLMNALFKKFGSLRRDFEELEKGVPWAIEEAWCKLDEVSRRQFHEFDERQCNWHTTISASLAASTDQLRKDIAEVRRRAAEATSSSMHMVECNVKQLENLQISLEDKLSSQMQGVLSRLEVVDQSLVLMRNLYDDVSSRQADLDKKLIKRTTVGPLLQSLTGAAVRRDDTWHDSLPPSEQPSQSWSSCSIPPHTSEPLHTSGNPPDVRAAFLKFTNEARHRGVIQEYQSLQSIVAEAREVATVARGRSIGARVSAAQRVASRSHSRDSHVSLSSSGQ